MWLLCWASQTWGRADLLVSGHCPYPPASSLPGVVGFRWQSTDIDGPPGWGLAGRRRGQCITLLFLQFADGVYLVLLMGLLEGYFVPLHSFFLTPDSFEQKVRRRDIREAA